MGKVGRKNKAIENSDILPLAILCPFCLCSFYFPFPVHYDNGQKLSNYMNDDLHLAKHG